MNQAFNNRLNSRPGKRERITVSNTVKQFTLTSTKLLSFMVPGSGDGKLADRKAEGAILQVTGDQVYYTVDGTDPSSSVGFIADAGDYLYLNSFQQIQNFKAIRVTGDATIEALAMFPA
jgi:hypothetical protein